MPWIKKVTGPHKCFPPWNDELEGFEAGSIWQCDKCNRVWEYKPYWLDAHRWVERPKNI